MEICVNEIEDHIRLSERLSLLVRRVGVPQYDFDFRTYLRVSSIFERSTSPPALLRIGAIEDYQNLETEIAATGFNLLQSYRQHLLASRLPEWYPVLSDISPASKWYSKLPSATQIGETLGWPVFIKGERQTSRHSASLSIARTPSEFDRICRNWRNEPILHWQKMVCRKFLSLQRIGTSRGDEVPPSKEFRAFFYKGQLVGIGTYWQNVAWQPKPSERQGAIELASEAARRLRVPFLVVDVALTEQGSWVVIECNDGQEAGYASINPLGMWQRIAELT